MVKYFELNTTSRREFYMCNAIRKKIKKKEKRKEETNFSTTIVTF